MKLLISAIRVDGIQDGIKIDPQNPVVLQAMGPATQHGVFPLYYQYVRKQLGDNPIPPWMESHKTAYLGNVGRNMQLTQRLLNVLDLLSRHAIMAIPFKGPVIAVQAYGDIGLRSFCDLDILIRSSDFSRVYDLMAATEYQSIKPMIARMKGLWRKTRRSFEFQGTNVIIDFHQQVSTGPRFLQLKIKWDEHSQVELNARKVFCLSLEDTILMLAMHGSHHGWNILKYVADLAYLVHSHYDHINWQPLIKKARRMGVSRMLVVGMMLGRDFCGLAVPEQIHELIAEDRKLKKLVTYFKGKLLEQRKSNLIPQTAFPRCLDSRWFQFRYLAYYLFNPTSLDMLAVRLPTILYPLYFVIRPARLLLNLARGRELS